MCGAPGEYQNGMQETVPGVIVILSWALDGFENHQKCDLEVSQINRIIANYALEGFWGSSPLQERIVCSHASALVCFILCTNWTVELSGIT